MFLPQTLPLTGAAPFWPGATLALDFVQQKYRVGAGSGYVTSLAGVPGWSFARPNGGTAEAADGTVASFTAGTPRITSRGLLVEESRTNLLLWSQDCEDAVWTKGGATVSANAVLAPDGSLTADKLVESGALTTHTLRQTVSKAASSLAYTFSVWAKAGERSRCRMTLGEPGLSNLVYLEADLAAGTILTAPTAVGTGWTATGGSITAYPNGWRRLVLSVTSDAAASVAAVVYVADASTAVFYAGDGSSGLYLWGAQLEQATFATSYIPTGVSTASRSQDVAFVTATLPPTPTILVEFDVPVGSTGTRSLAYWGDASSANRVGAVLLSSATAIFAASNSITQIFANNSVTPVGLGRVGVSFDGDSYRGVAASIALGPATGKVAPINATTLQIGRVGGATEPANAYLRRIIGYGRALGTSELMAWAT
jgi:hypothetical protein